MDWILSILTLLSNSCLGWLRGVWWIWLIHAVNAGIWIFYALMLKQYGLILLSVVTIIVDIISSIKSYRRAKLGG